ncbi:MAG: hypothetical protein DDT26_00431 [Dehalococcoidia bacterium]|nr:hypothetical protein [Chloroflexota bacterium]
MKVYIPTYRRSGKQLSLKSIGPKWADRVFLVCPSNETHEWPNVIHLPDSVVGSISKTRQWICDNGGEHIGMIDDDLSFYKINPDNRTQRTRLEDADELFDLMESYLKRGEVFCSPSASFMSHLNEPEYYFGKPAHCAFVNTEYMRTNGIRYDAIEYFEDFHVPLAILQSGKRLCMTGDYIAQELKANAAGGCSVNRTSARNRSAMERLAELHPRYVSIKHVAGAKNQNLEVGLKLRIAFKRCYDENVGEQDAARLPFD